MLFLSDEVDLTLKETGETDYPFGIFTVSPQGYTYRCIAKFEYHEDALLFVNVARENLKDTKSSI